MSVVLITGAGRGIGAHLSRELHRSGHTVFAGIRNHAAENDIADLVQESDFHILPLDVRDDVQSREAAASVTRLAGRLDVLVNNAGVGWLAPLELQSEPILRETLETNFFGALRMTRAVLPVMRRQRSGKIINISSLAAFHGLPAESAYCASKSALEAASQSLALEVERFGISVTSIRPGYTTAGLACSEIPYGLPRDTEYEPLLRHLEAYSYQAAEDAESPDLITAAVAEVIASDAPRPRIELGELAKAVDVVRQGGPCEQLDSMRAIIDMEWWRKRRRAPELNEERG